MKEDLLAILKKFWFVILVGVVFISMAIYFAWSTNKDKLSSKSVDGKDVIFSLNDKNYTADEYYKSLFNAENSDVKSGVALSYILMEKSVIDQSDNLTDKMEDTATTNFENSEDYYKQLYGDKYETTLGNQLKQMGYSGIDDFKQYFIDQEKKQKLVSDYIKKHKDLFDDVYEKNSPRVIEHILVTCSDPDNPSETEKAKMDKVDKALKKGTSFEKVAKKYSDDTATATKGGSLGVSLKDGSLDASFEEAAWNLKSGETTSKWVKSQYGYHLIKVVTTDKDEMLSNKDYFDSCVTAITTYYPNLDKQIIWEKAKKLGVKVDKSIKADLLKYMDVKK